jgi:hypothetical protein
MHGPNYKKNSSNVVGISVPLKYAKASRSNK